MSTMKHHSLLTVIALAIASQSWMAASEITPTVDYHALERCCCNTNETVMKGNPVTISINEKAGFSVNIVSAFGDMVRNYGPLYCNFLISIEHAANGMGLVHSLSAKKLEAGEKSASDFCPNLMQGKKASLSAGPKACAAPFVAPSSSKPRPIDVFGYEFTINNGSQFSWNSSFALTMVVNDKKICSFPNRPDDDGFHCSDAANTCVLQELTCNGYHDCPPDAKGKYQDEEAANCPAMKHREQTELDEPFRRMRIRGRNWGQTYWGLVHQPNDLTVPRVKGAIGDGPLFAGTNVAGLAARTFAGLPRATDIQKVEKETIKRVKKTADSWESISEFVVTPAGAFLVVLGVMAILVSTVTTCGCKDTTFGRMIIMSFTCCTHAFTVFSHMKAAMDGEDGAIDVAVAGMTKAINDPKFGALPLHLQRSKVNTEAEQGGQVPLVTTPPNGSSGTSDSNPSGQTNDNRAESESSHTE